MKSFLLFSVTFAIVIAAAAVPSPLYAVFQHQWHFSAATLTIIFAVYAVSLLAALLVVGSLSDYIGRRPVLMSALLFEAASMSIFALATGVVWLIIARIIQGFATGIATSALSAALIDAQPKNKPGLATLLSTTVPVGSLGVGAIFSGFLAEYVIWPTHLVFWIICSASLAAFLGIIFIPETAGHKEGWVQSLIPVVLLPQEAKNPLLQVGPSMIAVWALIGLYLSLGPSVAIDLLHTSNYVIGGLVVGALTAASTTSSILLRSKTSKQLITLGAAASIIGLAINTYSVASSNIILFFVGTIIAGVGFGPAFTGSFRSVMSHARSDERAGLAATVYVISYLALGIPVILAGIATTKFGLHPTALVYSIGVLILYLLTLVLSNVQLLTGMAKSFRIP